MRENFRFHESSLQYHMPTCIKIFRWSVGTDLMHVHINSQVATSDEPVILSIFSLTYVHF